MIASDEFLGIPIALIAEFKKQIQMKDHVDFMGLYVEERKTTCRLRCEVRKLEAQLRAAEEMVSELQEDAQ